jgi:hypothetical protein
MDGFIKKMILSSDSSCQTQISRVDSTVELYDLDNINDNWKEILKKININKYVELKQLNKSNKPSNIFLKKETIDLIKDHFSDDYSQIPKRTGQAWG